MNNDEERAAAGLKILQEHTMMETVFSRFRPDRKMNFQAYCSVLLPIAEVIRTKDKSMMSLELSGLVSKYNDITAEQMQALLALRGDFSFNEAKELTENLGSEIRRSSVPTDSGCDEQTLFASIENYSLRQRGLFR